MFWSPLKPSSGDKIFTQDNCWKCSQQQRK